MPTARDPRLVADRMSSQVLRQSLAKGRPQPPARPPGQLPRPPQAIVAKVCHKLGDKNIQFISFERSFNCLRMDALSCAEALFGEGTSATWTLVSAISIWHPRVGFDRPRIPKRENFHSIDGTISNHVNHFFLHIAPHIEIFSVLKEQLFLCKILEVT